jgi:hypothetical protein
MGISRYPGRPHDQDEDCAAVQRKSVKQLLIDLSREHIEDWRRRVSCRRVSNPMHSAALGGQREDVFAFRWMDDNG